MNFIDSLINCKNIEIDYLVKKRIEELITNCIKEPFEFPQEKKTTSYSDFISKDTPIQTSHYPAFAIRFDDEFKVYEKLAFAIRRNKQKLNETDFLKNCVRKTVFELLGSTNSSNNFDRVSIYSQNRENSISSISNFYGRDISECSERAVMAHNLFKFLGIESYLMMGPILLNGKASTHCYNVLYNNNKATTFDLGSRKSVQNENTGEIEHYQIQKPLNEKEIDALKEQRIGSQVKIDLQNKISPLTFKMASGKEYKIVYGQSNCLGLEKGV